MVRTRYTRPEQERSESQAPSQWLVSQATAHPALANGFLVAVMGAVAGALLARGRPWTLWLVVARPCRTGTRYRVTDPRELGETTP